MLVLGNVLRGFGLGSRVARQPLVSRDVGAFPPLCSVHDLAIIGDVHGMARLFEALLARLDAEYPAARIICVGDLIDRGDDSADVLRLAFDRRDSVTVLMGNHEEMMLRFLDDPDREAARWLRNGGLQTLASYRIAAPGSAAGAQEHISVRDRLRAAIGPQMETWLKGLPRYCVNGNIAVTHAGADPWLPISQQPDQVLTWGHPDFGSRRRTDGCWVAHGHVITVEPKAADGVISVDTGAFAGGGLTSAVIQGHEIRFVTEKL